MAVQVLDDLTGNERRVSPRFAPAASERRVRQGVSPTGAERRVVNRGRPIP
jgi:hypothetical protein